MNRHSAQRVSSFVLSHHSVLDTESTLPLDTGLRRYDEFAASRREYNPKILKVFTTPGATPNPLTTMATISILYYDCLTVSTF